MFRHLDIHSRTTPTTVTVPAMEDGALPVCATSISIRRYADWSAVMLRGELDRQSVADVRAAVATELAENRPVLIELVGLTFSDLDGLRALADLVERSSRAGASAGVEVHGARGQVARLIRRLGIGELLNGGP